MMMKLLVRCLVGVFFFYFIKSGLVRLKWFLWIISLLVSYFIQFIYLSPGLYWEQNKTQAIARVFICNNPEGRKTGIKIYLIKFFLLLLNN